MAPSTVRAIRRHAANSAIDTVTSYSPCGRSLRTSPSMCTTYESPTPPTGPPDADEGMTELSMAAWSDGSQSIASTVPG